MTLQEYIQELNLLVELYPQALNLPVVTYDQTYDTVRYMKPGVATVGLVEMQQFTALEYFEQYGIGADHANAVCIN